MYILRNDACGAANFSDDRLKIRLVEIRPNPGPVSTTQKSFSICICHWNLNSVWVDHFTKLTLIEAYLSVNKFDLVCLSETFLDSTISDDDPRLYLYGYNLIRCDHPSN